MQALRFGSNVQILVGLLGLGPDVESDQRQKHKGGQGMVYEGKKSCKL